MAPAGEGDRRDTPARARSPRTPAPQAMRAEAPAVGSPPARRGCRRRRPAPARRCRSPEQRGAPRGAGGPRLAGSARAAVGLGASPSVARPVTVSPARRLEHQALGLGAGRGPSCAVVVARGLASARSGPRRPPPPRRPAAGAGPTRRRTRPSPAAGAPYAASATRPQPTTVSRESGGLPPRARRPSSRRTTRRAGRSSARPAPAGSPPGRARRGGPRPARRPARGRRRRRPRAAWCRRAERLKVSARNVCESEGGGIGKVAPLVRGRRTGGGRTTLTLRRPRRHR